MKKALFLMFIVLFLPCLSGAEGMSSTEMADQYFSKESLSLTPQEQQALAIGRQWQTGNPTSHPVTGEDGSIKFVYGSGQTQVVCAVLQVCDVALQPGERVTNFNTGDPRFDIEPSLSGTGQNEMTHLLIKPRDVGLDTSLVVTTDRRTYHFRLRSTRRQFMPYASFIYPEDVQAKWSTYWQQRSQKTLPQTGEYLGNLHFDYQISGSASWKPLRVYNDGVKTMIEMPRTFSQSEAPTLLVIKSGGRLFAPSQEVMVNYRLQGNRYIVDSVFDKAILVAGVGAQQARITLTREVSHA